MTAAPPLTVLPTSRCHAKTKATTVLFADIVGSTGFYERLGDTHARGIVGSVLDTLGGAIRRNGGRVVKTIGDAVMAEFPSAAGAVDAAMAVTRPPKPIFQGERIVLQLVRLPQPAFSAALLAYVEAHYDGDAEKNRLCSSVPFPHTMDSYARAMALNLWNQFQWGQDKTLRQWIRASRLDGFGKLMTGIDPQDHEKQAILARMKEQAGAAMANIQRLIASAG